MKRSTFSLLCFFFLEKIVFLFFVVLNRLSSQHHRAVDAVARRTQPTASPNGKRSVLFCFVFCFFSLPFPSAFSRFWLRDLLDSFFPLFCLYPILVCFFFNGIGLDPFFFKLFLWRIFSHGLRLYFRASRPFLWRSFVSVSLSRHFRCFFQFVTSIRSTPSRCLLFCWTVSRYRIVGLVFFSVFIFSASVEGSFIGFSSRVSFVFL